MKNKEKTDKKEPKKLSQEFWDNVVINPGLPTESRKERMIYMKSYYDFLYFEHGSEITNEDCENPKLIERLHDTFHATVFTLCGSSKYKKEFEEVTKMLSLKGCLVISLGLFGHSGDGEAFVPKTKAMLNAVHLQKIDMSDAIFVIDKDYYIGESTKREIEYAKSKNKKIYYYSEYLIGKRIKDREKTYNEILSTLKCNVLDNIEHTFSSVFCNTADDLKLYMKWFNQHNYSIFNDNDLIKWDDSYFRGPSWYTIYIKEISIIKKIVKCEKVLLDNIVNVYIKDISNYRDTCRRLFEDTSNFDYDYSINAYKGPGWYYTIPYNGSYKITKLNEE